MLNAARWAPTHGMTQPWFFDVFMEDSLKEISDFYVNTYGELNQGADFKQAKEDQIKMRFERTSVAIAVCMKRQEIEKIPEIEEVEAVACAVQNLHVLATSFGLGGYWSTGKIAYSDQMKSFLGLGEKDKCLGVFYLGYPEDEWPKSHRKPLEYHVNWR